MSYYFLLNIMFVEFLHDFFLIPMVYITKIVVIVLAKDLQIHYRSSGNSTAENLFPIKFYLLVTTDQDS